MKKTKIIIVIIWILSIAGIVLYSKTIKQNKKTSELVEEPIEHIEHQYIDYTGFYDENDLSIEKLYLDDEEYFSYIKISGLKDKNIENEINEKLYNMINSFSKEEYSYAYSVVTLNAFNIFSAYSQAHKDGEHQYKIINIDLTTGNEIKLDDIINDKNITRPISKAYYNTVAFMLGAEKKYDSRYLDEYRWCIEHGEECSFSKTIDEVNEIIKKYDEYLSNLEEESLVYARNYDKNTPFYITSAGIVVPGITAHDIKSNNEMYIFTKDNPRLFNFYYKYKTDESIYDGTYQGKKNIMLSEFHQYMYDNPYSKIIDDYAIVHFESYNNESKSIDTLNKYLERLDKNNFSFIYEISLGDDNLFFNECTMTKDVYNNEVKKEYADGILNSRHTQGHYSINNKNSSCNHITIYNSNPDVEILYSEGFNDKVTSYRKLRIINNKEKENEINEKIKNEVDELIGNYSSIAVYVNNVTENKIYMEINYFEEGTTRMQIKPLEFDL